MRYTFLLLSAFTSAWALPWPHSNVSNLAQIDRAYSHNVWSTLSKRKSNATCHAGNVEVRKQWGDMPAAERQGYISAVTCLFNKPSKGNKAEVPGAVNRFDDFVAAHILQAPHVHYSGHFFAWHRHFLWLYGQALQNECGYTGTTPYWDWTLNHDDIFKDPVFDGGPLSFGGNGAYCPHGATYLHSFGRQLVGPAGTGGGCVEYTPFGNITVHLSLNLNVTNDTDPTVPQAKFSDNKPRPVIKSNQKAVQVAKSPSTAPPSLLDPYGDNVLAMLHPNPRCLQRDINPAWARLMTFQSISYLLQCEDMKCLERRIDGWESGVSNETNAVNQLHNEGHLVIGGLNNNQYASAGDPVFYAHHGMMDRVWAWWQGQEPAPRVKAVGGTYTAYDEPPSDEVQPDDVLVFPFVGDDLKLGDVGSTIDGPYCYVYG